MERKKIKRAVKIIVIVCLVVIAGYFVLNAVIQKKDQAAAYEFITGASDEFFNGSC